MTDQEAQAELKILRGLAEGGGDLALVKERIDRLYWAVCRKHLRTCKCKDKYRDALYEIYAKLRFNDKNNTTMAKARLVNGVVLQVGGTHYTNANLTDEVARAFLSAFPMRKDWFAELPPAEAEDAEKQGEPKAEDVPEKQGDEDAENVAEKPADEVKVEEQPTAPKEKKSAEKRK